jgi:hypothetical protein
MIVSKQSSRQHAAFAAKADQANTPKADKPSKGGQALQRRTSPPKADKSALPVENQSTSGGQEHLVKIQSSILYPGLCAINIPLLWSWLLVLCNIPRRWRFLFCILVFPPFHFVF